MFPVMNTRTAVAVIGSVLLATGIACVAVFGELTAALSPDPAPSVTVTAPPAPLAGPTLDPLTGDALLHPEFAPQFDPDGLVGMAEADAQAATEVSGWVFRVGERDGEQYATTKDYNPQRVTVAVTNSVITGVAVG